MSDRLITPSQLALFSRSPVIGAWWEEVHATTPERAPRPAAAALDELLFASGLEHEQVLIERLEAAGRSVARLRGRQEKQDYDATLAAMRSGVDFIWQSSLRNDEMRGSADLLERIEQPSKLGAWSYIPIECKLSSHPRPIYLVQACAYCELLEPILGERPEHFRLYLGGGRFAEGEHGYPVARFWSWYEQLRQRYRDFRAGFDPSQEPEDAPGDHGLWGPFIEQRLEAKRDLILVAGMRQSQRHKLRAAGITTIDALASCPDDQWVEGLDSAPAIVRLAKVKGLDVIAITDLFSADFVDRMVSAAKDSPLTVIPGVSIRCRVGSCDDVVFACLFGESVTGERINEFLRALEVPTDAAARAMHLVKKPLPEVLSVIDSFGGVAIPSRLDKTPTQKSIIKELVETYGFRAFDLAYGDSSDYFKKTWPKVAFQLFTFSDANALAQIGSRTAKVKMALAGLEGIRELVARQS